MTIRDKIVEVLREHDEVRNIGGLADDLENSLESLQCENEELRDWIKTATVKITSAIGGGSEMFTRHGRHGDDFRVDPEFVATLVKTRRERYAESKKASIVKERELTARIEAAEADASRLRALIKKNWTGRCWRPVGDNDALEICAALSSTGDTHGN